MKYTPLMTWYLKSNSAQKKELMALLKINHTLLSRIGTNKKSVGPELAIKLEAATTKMSYKYPELPVVRQSSSCQTCSHCPYSKK